MNADNRDAAAELDRVTVTASSARGLSALLSSNQITILDDVSLRIPVGTVVGLGGESGCGKSTVANVLTGLMQVAGGTVRIAGTDVTRHSDREWRTLRHTVQLIFQDPFSTLNPRFTVYQSVAEPLASLRLCARSERRERVEQALADAELEPSKFIDRYPRQLSGGERQRVSIARALVAEPTLIVADEPVSMLDATAATEVTGLLRQLANQKNVSVLLISHDLKLLGAICDHVAVMYLGRVLEQGSPSDVLGAPRHPYTQLLVSAVPNVDPRIKRPRVRLDGAAPALAARPSGCPFHPRCPRADGADCDSLVPELDQDNHQVACFHPIAPAVRPHRQEAQGA
jgi:oligopeptide/dipeptide ABC transporter ATP-binding protein